VPPASRSVRSLSGLLPFLTPYRGRIASAVVFLVLAAVSTLIFPVALRSLIDQGFVAADPGERVMAMREHFFALFAVGAALGLFSALRFYMVTWLGERVTADLRNAVYSHVVTQSPQFFETTQTGEVLSRLTTDTTLVQTVGRLQPLDGAAQRGARPGRDGDADRHQPVRDVAGARHPRARRAARRCSSAAACAS
jgi:ATP-binding cassette subfamily B protein